MERQDKKKVEMGEQKQFLSHHYISAGCGLLLPVILPMMWRMSTMTMKEMLITITAVGDLQKKNKPQ